MMVTTIDLYNILKIKIGENEAKTLVEFIELRVEKEIEENMDELAGKRDLFQIKSELELGIEKVRSDLVKWMFIFWVGQVSVTVGLILLVVK